MSMIDGTNHQPRPDTPGTFAEYVLRYGLADVLVDSPEWVRDNYDRARISALVHPQRDDMPPCPSWCTLGYGHQYDTVDDLDVAAGMVTLIRFHYSPDEAGDASVSKEERWRAGRVTLHAPVIVTGGDCEEMAASTARRRAAALLNAADRLDAITAQE